MKKVNITINGVHVEAHEGETVLEVCRKLKIDIPTLCFHEDQKPHASCRLCIVQINENEKMQTSCSTYVSEGMNIKTHSEKVVKEREITLQLLLAGHDFNCTSCVRNMTCELQEVSSKLGIKEIAFDSILKPRELDESNPALVRNKNKCIKCGRCMTMCTEIQGLDLLKEMGRGHEFYIGPAAGKFLNDVACTFCGQCSTVCPVAAITEKSDIEKVISALHDSTKHVVVQVAPSVRVSLGESFRMDVGTDVTGKMVKALKMIGFNQVFDTNFTADLTIIEEASELQKRVKTGGVLPMVTSCCPGWINYVEQYYPQQIPNLSTCKSPQAMFGTLTKTYYSDKINIKPEDIFTVSIMPCTSKKYEANRLELDSVKDVKDVDAVLTTRELAKLIERHGINFKELDEDKFDDPFGIASGAGVIFGNTGGVMEAALRSFYELETNKEIPTLEFSNIRGLEGFKEATVNVGGLEVKVAVVHTLKNARTILEQIKNGTSEYAFIEVMACPGGCIGGGGQPYKPNNAKKLKRIEALYKKDKALSIRKSHDNPGIITLYNEFLKYPLSPIAHKLLHTNYIDRTHN